MFKKLRIRLAYAIYWCRTIDARNAYDEGRLYRRRTGKDIDIVWMRETAFGTEYDYVEGRQQQRRYMTLAEFAESRNAAKP